MVSLMYILLFFLFIFFLIKLYYTKPTTTTKNLPPSPPKLPVIGNLHQLDPLLHRSLHSLSQRYAAGAPFMLFHLGSIRVVVASTADAAREIMKTHDLIFANRPDTKMFRKISFDLKVVSVAPYGEYWRQMKSIFVLNFLSTKRVQSFCRVREEEIGLVVDGIKKSCFVGGVNVVDLCELFPKVTNDVVCRVTFGRKYSEGESGRRFTRMLREFFQVLGGVNLGDSISWLAFVDRIRGVEGRAQRVAEEMDGFLDGVVEQRLSKESTGGDDGEYFVDILLNILKDETTGNLLDRVAIKALLLDAYAAGTDTTATVLEWVMTELLKHPRVMKKVQTEVRTTVKDRHSITEDDLEKMNYLKAVFKETLRLHPPIPTLVPRIASQDVKVMGYDITKGTRVVINAWAIGRDEKIWDEPEVFRPERFLDSSIDFRGRDFELIPFGAGRRGCPGITFAMATAENLIANLLHKFDWKLPNGGTEDDLDMSERPGLTIRKKIPLLAVATPFDL